ncbi:MAG: hypothetical protein HOO67_03505 [Candidatus Peribacteraceae bacterium]|nr:hypothetical protein [Candidatus Peribacteraceae bacterium]
MAEMRAALSESGPGQILERIRLAVGAKPEKRACVLLAEFCLQRGEFVLAKVAYALAQKEVPEELLVNSAVANALRLHTLSASRFVMEESVRRDVSLALTNGKSVSAIAKAHRLLLEKLDREDGSFGI